MKMWGSVNINITSIFVPINDVSVHLELRVDLADHAQVEGVEDFGSVHGDHCSSACFLQENLWFHVTRHLEGNRIISTSCFMTRHHFIFWAQGAESNIFSSFVMINSSGPLTPVIYKHTNVFNLFFCFI